MKRKILLVATFGLLGACATQTDKAVEAYNKTRTESFEALKSCFTDVFDTPSAKVIVPKSNPIAAEPTEDQLADETKITDDEKLAINELLPPLHVCFANYTNTLTGMAAPYVPVYNEWIAGLDKNTALLLKRKQTWGEYNKHTAEIKVVFEKDKDAVRESIDQKFTASQNRELRYRAAAMSAATDGFNQAPQYNPTPMPSYAPIPQPSTPPATTYSPSENNSLINSYYQPQPAPMGVGQGTRGYDGTTYIPAGPDPNPSPNVMRQ